MTSPTTGAIGGAKGHQPISYKQHLTKGDRALTDGKLDEAEENFASALKLIHDPNKPDRCKEAECLRRLGDVYVQLGKTTREGRKFTQAAALYNAAMARTDEDKQKAMKRLVDVEQWFLHYTANVEINPCSSDLAIRHQERLEDMRMRAKSQLDAIDQQHNPYQFDEDDPKMLTVEAERAEAVKALFKNIAKDRQMFIQDLVEECIATLGPPPCKYAFIGLGSQATELVTPYSDLEFAILIEDGKDNDDTRRYFLNLTHYLHLKVINLGETILPAMAIPSLNDFPENDWFVDFITPRGFAFDGFMPWASKTPFGRDKTRKKPPVSLIQTPVEMAKFQRLDISVSEGYHLSDILRRVVFLTGEKALVHEYMGKLNEIITDDLLSQFQPRLSAKQILWESKEQLFSHEPTGQLINVKKDIYRFPGMAIEVLALCSQITLASVWNTIDNLKETEKIQGENATHLTVLISISAELRLKTYISNGGQQDSLSPLMKVNYPSQPQNMSESTLKSVFYIPDTSVLFRYYCRAIPLKKCLLDVIKNSWPIPQKRLITTAIFDTSNQCRGRITRKLFLSDKSLNHFEAALKDAGCDEREKPEILLELGSHWLSTGNINKAISLFEQSINTRKRLFGDNTANPGIANSLNNLGLSWDELGDQTKAISYYEQSLTMMKTIYGHKSAYPDIASSLENLGNSWNELGDYKKAMSYYQQSLTMRKAIYGENTEHPDISKSLNNLGNSWNKLGYHKRAMSYYEQSLMMKKNIYGNNTAHPDITTTLINLGSSWSNLGDHKKAMSYYEQSLTMMKTIYGDNTALPEIVQSLNNLGTSWSKLGDQRKAISYYEQSLTMMKNIYGGSKAHPYVASTLNNLGSSWSELGDQRKAISYYEQSLTMRKIVYGHNRAHPDIAMSLNNLGLSWSHFGDRRKGIGYFEQSLKMSKTIYGDNTSHPDIAMVLDNLGSSWSNLGYHEKAIAYYEKSLKMKKTIYGDTAHPDIAQSLNRLKSSWSKLGNRKKKN
ncbi:TTC28 [Branchiostoma lanceolatum]|nr:TTC28 [Branchiostoma lanceolatum]